MFEFSRALYRQVSPWMETGSPAKLALVTQAEASIVRVFEDPSSSSRLAQRLFAEVRHLFPLSRQAAVRRAIDATCSAAAEEAARHTGDRLDAFGERRQCPQLTRRGTPCRREPLSNGYCPSHQHLAAERTGGRALSVA